MKKLFSVPNNRMVLIDEDNNLFLQLDKTSMSFVVNTSDRMLNDTIIDSMRTAEGVTEIPLSDGELDTTVLQQELQRLLQTIAAK